MTRMGVMGRGPTVIKAPSDERQYEVVHLKNGLTVLLIHDPLMSHASGIASSEHDYEESTEDGISGADEEGESGGEDNDDENREVSMCGDENHCSGHGHDGHSHITDRSHEASEVEDEESDEELGAPIKKSSRMAPTKKAAAAMCVGVGSFSDPPDAQGLAHFLEHMLFMGSSKFPDENEYDNFLSKHGGSSNAFTDTEYTCYHFDVNFMHLKPALDRFSQFFVAPLAKADAMDREVQAIDSEFEQVLQSDSCRLLQLQCHTANPKHPFHTFSWGNKVSLGLPMANGVDMRSKMLKLYESHYLAGQMKLVVLGGEPLDTLREWVTELFEDIRSGGEKKSFRFEGSVWEQGQLYRLESVKDQHLLSLMWPFPCLHNSYSKKPQDYISHLVGHEGAGSILSLLKKKGYATALSAGVGDSGYEHSTAGYMFNVTVHLTLAGLDQLQDVISLFYQYMKMLRASGPQDWVFKELQAMSMMEFKFAEEEPAESYVVRLASNMHLYTEEHIIYGDYAFEEWDAKLVNDLLDTITPNNMRLDVVSKQFNRNSPDVQLEPWFEAPYIVETIPEDVVLIWSDPPHLDLSLHMPAVNEFIPHDFSIRTPKQGADMSNVPVILLDSSSVKLWYKLDKTFHTPRANAFLSIMLGAASRTLKMYVLTELYVKILVDALNETLYLAHVAKLESSMSVSGDKIELKLFGFNENLHLLALKISKLYKTFVPTEDRFQAMKEDLERIYRNTNMKPLKHSAYLRLQILKENFWHVDDKLLCLLSLSLQDVIDFIPQLFGQTYMEALCHGNLSQEEALNTISIFKDAFFSSDLLPEQRSIERIYKLPEGQHVLQAHVKNALEENSVVEMYFQLEPDLGQQSLRNRAILDLFEEIISEPYFNQLRTKEQLGYRVDCGARVTHRILGFCFRVQSSTYSPGFLQHRMNTFIGSLQQLLANMNEEEFVGFKDALIAEKMERDHSLIDETDRHWEQIWEKRYIFEAKMLEALELHSIQKNDMLKWISKHLAGGAPSQRKLCIHISGNRSQSKGPDVTDSTENLVEIEDILAFKNGLELYPIPI